MDEKYLLDNLITNDELVSNKPMELEERIYSLAPIKEETTEQVETITQLTAVAPIEEVEVNLVPEVYVPQYEKNPLVQIFKANTALAHTPQQELMKTLHVMNRLLFSIAVGVVVLIIVNIVDSYTTNKHLRRIEALIEETQLTAKENYSPEERLEFVMEIREELNRLNYIDPLATESVYAENESSFAYKDLQMNPKVVSSSDGKEYPLELNIEAEGETKFKISADNAKEVLVPGKYEIQVELAKGDAKGTVTQDFVWGVLVLNTNKSMYTPGEEGIIAMAVLDDNGDMVCDADVSLEITSPSGKHTTLSTKDRTIWVTDGCHRKDLILDPDFETAYVFDELGVYNFTLTAITENGTRSIDDSVEVKDYVSFDIERMTATRIYPKLDYPVVLKVRANETYTGKIIEKVPSDYGIIPTDKETIEKLYQIKIADELYIQNFTLNDGQDEKEISWDATLEKDNTYFFAYFYDAPNISPDYKVLGELSIGTFTEQRKWQIAVDSIAILDVHSSPDEDEEWIVRFETTGTGDLYITPDNQATIDDDEFTTLMCGEEVRSPQILEGDIIYYPNWECDEIAIVIHKTLKKGNHILRFDFLGETAYAYNATWLTGSNYRKSLTFTGSSGGAQTDYVMRIRAYYGSGTDTSDQVYCGGNCKSDFSDVRFASSDGYTELSYWRETYTDGTSATLWVEVDSIPASPSTKTIYMYYGNPSATTASNGSSTFQFFDDFSGNLSQWTIDPENTDDKVYIYNGALRHDPDSTQTKSSYFDTRAVTSSYTMQNGIIEYSLYLAGTPRIIHQFGWRVPGNNLGSGYCWRLQNSSADAGHLEFTGIASWSTFGTAYPAVSGSTWHTVREIVNGTTYTGYVNGGSGYSGTDATTTGANKLVSHVHGVSLTSASYALVDNVRTRKYVSPEPSYSGWGSQEQPVIDITGAAYTDDDEASTLSSVSVCAAVNSSHDSGDCDTTDGSGVFDIQDVTVSGSSSQQITLFVDGGSTYGNVVTNTKLTSTSIDDITGVKLYQNHVLLSYETGDTISIIDMDSYDNDQNSTDMLFDAEDSSPDTLTWESGIELYVPSGKNFTPGGNLNGHDLEIDGTYTAGSGETINLDGTFKLDSGGTFVPSTSTLTFDASSGTEDLITAGTGNLYNLVINDGGGSLTVEVEDPLTVENNITTTNGTLDTKSGENNQITVRGNWTNDDIFEARLGTVIFDGASSTTLDSGCVNETTCTNDDFYNMTINKAQDASVSLSNTHLRVANLFRIIEGIFNQGSYNVQTEGATALRVDDFGRYRNLSTGNLTLGGNVVVDGEITLDSNGKGCGDSDDIVIASTTTTNRTWSGEGGFRLTDVTASYQTGSAVVHVGSGTDAGNNLGNWAFVSCGVLEINSLDLEGLEIN